MADFTFDSTRQGFAYVGFIIDVFVGVIVGPAEAEKVYYAAIGNGVMAA
ncbi:hypothetical protein [Edwardsiella ictaluri]|nr:hypothetical protein [Edwardsiella ictaluri]WFO09709.1 hypothetical protein MAY76_16580 [Edwardsiella ictaluri]WFO12624.1 hypothetical protein MAY82_16660 [Edwardsiella ictaluri]